MSITRLSPLAFGVTFALATSTSFSAGLDRTGQDIRGFFNEGTYAEMDFAYLSTDISGYDHGSTVIKNPPLLFPKDSVGIAKSESDFVKGNETGSITGEGVPIFKFGVKADVNDYLSVGVFYDQPFGAKVRFENDGNFVSNKDQKVASPNKDANGNDTAPIILDMVDGILGSVNNNVKNADYQKNTQVSVETETLTGLVGLKVNDFQVYGGPVIQKAAVDLSLRGNAYGPLTGYDLKANKNTANGWVAGVSFSKPEILLNAALTYRSEIEHEGEVKEYLPFLENNTLKLGATGKYAGIRDLEPTMTQSGSITTPESVNFNFQTGLSREYQLLGTLNARWVPWSKFTVDPPMYSEYTKAATGDPNKGLSILSYTKDQINVDVGLAKRFSPNLAGSAIIGWDSGAGNPVSSLGPVDGAWSVGGGLKYNVTPQWAVSAGGKYIMFGDATSVLPTGSVVGQFEDNTGYAVGMKLSYQQK